MENGALNVLSCKYPTTLVVVDDSPEFLQVVVSMLNQNNDVTIKTFIDPEQALKFINDESSMNSLDYTKLTKEGTNWLIGWFYELTVALFRCWRHINQRNLRIIAA